MSELFAREIGGRTLSMVVGKVAGLANGAVTVHYGDTVVLVTACMSSAPREGIDFFPLTVDFEERMYAAGKIPGGWFRREGRPGTSSILIARLTDRPLRPLFPKGLRNDVQIIATALSADQENDPDILTIIGASAALSISDIPWGGPVSGTRVGYIDEQYVVNPTYAQLKDSDLDLVVVGTRDAVVMVEAGASEVSEAIMLEAIRVGQATNAEIIGLQDEMVSRLGKTKSSLSASTLPDDIGPAVADFVASQGWDLVSSARGERDGAAGERLEGLTEALGERYSPQQLKATLDDASKQAVRNRILKEGTRPDGRRTDEIRPISCEVALLPRTHGSGLFTRGETQVLALTTLGSMGEQQRLDGLEPEEMRRFIHHYNFPPFSVGETRPLRGPSRRDTGHGALAERAMLAVIPSEEEFPYTIRLVSEVLSSNGSTSMASVCSSVLSLMDAGVPIKAPVAGVAMGLIKGEDNYRVLTDIAGLEDSFGDMDFKVAGTATGITALQMDIKIGGITDDILDQALTQAREARLFILEKMREAIPEVRSEMSPYAPRMYRLSIPQDKIGAVIGPGGRVIRSIIEETTCSVDIEDDGTVFIGSPNETMAQKAISIIEGLTKEVEVGEVYTGTVTRLTGFGAFVEILPGKDGLVRLEDLAEVPARRPEDVVSIDDEVMVMVIEVDNLGRINLSRRAVLEGLTVEQARESSQRAQQAGQASRGDRRPPRRDFGGGGGGQRPYGGRGGGGGGGGGGNGRPRGGGGRPPQNRGGGPRPNDQQQRPGFRREPGDPPPPPPPTPFKRW